MRNTFALPAVLFLLGACTTRYYPNRPNPSTSPAAYAAVINLKDPRPDLRNATLISSVSTIDRGYSRDCAYAEIVEKIRRKAMYYGANLVVVTQHRPPDTDHYSQCSRIRANLFTVNDLAGMEAEIFWSQARPLAAADLRAHPAGALPAVDCNIRYRLLGDFYKRMIVRTITTFFADSTAMPDGPGATKFGVRRAQLQFNMAEVESRKFKQKIETMSPDVKAITSQVKTLHQNTRQAWHDRSAQFDAEFARASNQQDVLVTWEQTVNAELEALAKYGPDYTLDLQA